MKRQERRRWTPCLLALASAPVLVVALGVGSAFGHGGGEGVRDDGTESVHHGMMGGGYGQGYRQGHGEGHGEGHGMGPGMMGGRQGDQDGGYYGGRHGDMMDDMGPGLGMGPGMMSGMPGGIFFDGLSAEQVKQVRELLRAHRSAQFARMEEMAELRLDLSLLLQDPRPDPDQARTLNQRLAELHGAMLEERLRLHNALQDLLTAEQREQRGLPDS
ncbi:periplasmic heavy metal sensor [Halomonas sp. I5-271120]|uniref:periplasmic heavy metal sensor n=1 Tax=Halomonas sp. I5-271120 TaxID=3061632 RepID=UPI0027149C57|nr:periplasmic heavy metal sensor [Halomonas sp. I5-271120]